MASSKKEDTALATIEEFKPLAVTKEKATAIAEAIQTNVGEISAFDLDQIIWPAGGGRTWEVPTLGDVERVDKIDCVILHAKEVRQYWSERYSGEGIPPDCASADCKTGYGRPGGPCNDCPFSQWGTATNAEGEPAKGQACQQRRHCLILTPWDAMPRFLSVPPTSTKVLGKFMLRLAGNELLYYHARVGLCLEKAKSGDSMDYSRLVPVFIEALSEEQAAVAGAYRDALANVITSRTTQEVGAQRLDVDEDPADDNY